MFSDNYNISISMMTVPEAGKLIRFITNAPCRISAGGARCLPSPWHCRIWHGVLPNLLPARWPIGSARGLNNVYGLRSMRAHFPDIPLVVDAGLGVPSHAAAAMELGYDAVLLNTAVAEAGDPVEMARAFALGVEAGRAAYLARPMEPRDMAVPSTPVIGKAALGD